MRRRICSVPPASPASVALVVFIAGVGCVVAGCAHMVDTTLWQPSNAAAALMPWPHAAELPDRTEVTAGQLVIHADFPLAGQHRLVRELESLRADVSQELGLPISDEPVHLYLFENPAKYDAFVAEQFPSFPARRAFFVETDTRLSVFAAWQDRVAEDLRHETTHGYVHSVVPTIPLWLDEGVAEFFELPRAEQGLHGGHVAHLAGKLLEGTWQPNLDKLEQLASAGELSQDHYAEAWCWVHWLLRTTPERRALLQDYLAGLRRGSATPPLSARLRYESAGAADLSAALRSHVDMLASRPR